MIRDTISSFESHQIVSRLHIHPDCVLRRVSDRAVAIEYGGGSTRGHCTVHTAGGLLGVEDGWFCPEFGVRQRTSVLTLSTFGSRAVLGFSIISDSTEAAFDLSEGTVVHGHAYGW